jgi:hypothetical protein
VVLNPVRAGIVERPEDYRWSSYRATAGFENAPDWMDVDSALNAFAPDKLVAQMYYREFVLAKIGCEDRLWDHLVNALYLGTEAWTKTMRQKAEGKPRSTDHPRVQRAVGRPKIREVVSAVARAAGVGASEIRATRGGPLRQLVASPLLRSLRSACSSVVPTALFLSAGLGGSHSRTNLQDLLQAIE